MYLIIFHGLETVPKIAGIADEIPSYLFIIKVKVPQKFVVSFFHTFQLFLGGFRAFGKGKYAGDLCMIIEKCSVELSVNVVFALKLLSVSE